MSEADAAPQVAQVAGDRLSLAGALGGKRGVLDSGLPGFVFVATYAAARQDLTPAVWAAVVTGAALTVVRLVRRETLQHAVAGFVAVAACAFIAQRTGKAENFFLPGLLINSAYTIAYALSAVARWPLIGVIVGSLTGEGMAWRRDPPRLRAYTVTTWLWAGMFLARLAVQLPLYLTGSIVALGVARLAMGWPLFALAAWVSYLILRRVPATQSVAAQPDESASPASG